MIDAGYFARRIPAKPGWLAAHVSEICSVSECISEGPPGWIQRWRHNSLGWFNRPDEAASLIPADAAPSYRLFAYRLLPEVFGHTSRVPFVVPADVRPDPIPATYRSLGFDSVSKSTPAGLCFECSPLSCNGMASELSVNAHCLFPALEDAIAGAARFAIEQPEPGDYYVVEVLEARGAESPR
jgi:hypothetical protein